MSVSTITKAVLISPDGTQAHNIAIFEVPKGPEWQVGASVTTAACTTATFNLTGTISQTGVFQVLEPVDNVIHEWSGFAVIVNHAVIAVEYEPSTAIVTQ